MKSSDIVGFCQLSHFPVNSFVEYVYVLELSWVHVCCVVGRVSVVGACGLRGQTWLIASQFQMKYKVIR